MSAAVTSRSFWNIALISVCFNFQAWKVCRGGKCIFGVVGELGGGDVGRGCCGLCGMCVWGWD